MGVGRDHEVLIDAACVELDLHGFRGRIVAD